MSTNGEGKKSKKILSKTYVGFIDVLFAVVLGQSFVLLTSHDYYGTWFNSPYVHAFGLVTLSLVYGLVISSWVGYHLSVEVYPIHSIWRFFIDIVLLFLYYFAFANAGNFSVVLVAITSSFLAYVVWDGIRIYEHRSKLSMDLWERLVWSLIFFILYVVVDYLYGFFNPLIQDIGWLFLAVAMALLILYRYVKWYR